LGEVEEARSAFLRAASLETNFAPDDDYLELAALYKTLAAEAEAEPDQQKYLASAIEMWEYALRVPGLPAAKRRAIKNYISAEEQLLAGAAWPENRRENEGLDGHVQAQRSEIP
ncbi:MAG: hypothetical protein WD873_03385, partial [Candidatus Hydrogenedentales bacterium]